MVLEERISAIVPTLNRASHSGNNVRLNPIWWAAHSLFNQKNVGEIVFVDDGSQDHFLETVDALQSRAPRSVHISYRRNGERLGSGTSRNLGVAMAKYDRIFFFDDDCVVIGDNTLSHLNTAYNLLEREGWDVGAINLPVNKGTVYNEIVPSRKIGRVNQFTGMMDDATYTKFPLEYVSAPRYIDPDKEILFPLPVDFMHGVFLTDRKKYFESGGFPTTEWRNGCAEEPELAFEMQNKGYDIFYLPFKDVGNRVFHIRYGGPQVRRIDLPYHDSFGGVSFDEIYAESSSPKSFSHGNRVDEVERYHSAVVSNARLMFKYFGPNVGLHNLHTQSIRMSGTARDRNIFESAVTSLIGIMSREGIIDSKMAGEIGNIYLSSSMSYDTE